jgi:Family of unknown function (DUF6491)
MKLMKSVVLQFVTILVLGIVAGCATPGEPDSRSSGDVDFRGSDCILISTIRDYTPLDDSNLLIYGPGKRAYFVTLVHSTFELRSSFRLQFSSRDGQLCPYGGDEIVVGSFGHEAVGIRAISRVTEEQAEQLLIRYGRKEPAEQQAPAPEDVKGAEVEELG